MKFIGIIPARYASTRFPGKPLADMKGKYMIQRVYEQVRKILDNVCVATDDDRIFNAVKSFGGNVVMTSAEHRSGTDRCFEAYNRLEIYPPNNGPINTFTTSTSACMDTKPTYCPRSPGCPSRRSKSQNRSNNSGGCKTAIRLKWASPHKKQSV